MKKTDKRTLLDGYKFSGFITRATITGKPYEPKAQVIRMVRRQKKQFVADAEKYITLGTIRKPNWFVISVMATV